MIKENNKVVEEFRAKEWHEAGYTGKGVTIVLLDGEGHALQHMKDYYTDVLGKQKEHGHATNVGMVAHTFAPGARILMFDSKRDGEEAFEWIKKHKDEIDLINVSLAGIEGSTTPKYERYETLGIPLICASGNDGYEDHISYPARYSFTIAFGSFVWRDTGAFSRDVDGDSNWGKMLDAVAPTGIHVKNAEGNVYTVYGTSYAAPSATGMLACYVQWRNEKGLPKLTVKEARKFIRENCIDIREEGFDYASGHGLFVLPDISKLTASQLPNPEKPIEKEEPTVTKPIEFKDAKGHWAEAAIKQVAQQGLMVGRTKDSFAPNEPMTRAEMAVILTRLK